MGHFAKRIPNFFAAIRSSSNVSFHPEFPESLKRPFESSFISMEDFITEEEESGLMKEFNPHLDRLVYERDHWDDAIVGFRETERKLWNSANAPVITRLRETAFKGRSELKPLPQVHVLDLAADGHIKPHVDSDRFCGPIVAVLSLLSDSVLRFRKCDGDKKVDEERPEICVDCFVRRRSLYVMNGGLSRFEMTHEILDNQVSLFNGGKVKKDRRISIVCRCDP